MFFSRGMMPSFDKTDSLMTEMRQSHINFSAIIRLILANPSKINVVEDVHGRSLLRLAAEKNPQYIPALLQLGADPNLADRYRVTAIRYLLSVMPVKTARFPVQYISCALTLLQHGAHITDDEGEKLLDHIYKFNPEMKNYFLRSGIPADKLNDSKYIFSHINIAALRRMINVEHPEQVRKAAIKLFILLALENAQAKKSNQRATSFFSRLPPDVLRIIAGFLAIDGQVFPGALEDVRVFLFNNPDLIAQNEIIVPLTEKAAWQGARKIRLNSVPSLERRCREYSLFKVNLSREDKAQQKYAFLEILLHKEFTADSEKKLAEYRARVLESYLQVSSFNVVEYLTKLESISDSEFYQDAKLENLDQLRLKKI